MKALITYTLAWFLVLTATIAVYFTDNFNDMAQTIFGFIFATLFFALFVAVLPFLMDEWYSRNY